MTCPECEETRRQFLAMRRAVLAFARTLSQFENRRLAEVDVARPFGAIPMTELRALIERDTGLTLNE